MAEIAKIVTVIGQSPESFAKAGRRRGSGGGEDRAGVHGVDVISMSALVDNDRISMYAQRQHRVRSGALVQQSLCSVLGVIPGLGNQLSKPILRSIR